jgi:hypothetical protein
MRSLKPVFGRLRHHLREGATDNLFILHIANNHDERSGRKEIAKDTQMVHPNS